MRWIKYIGDKVSKLKNNISALGLGASIFIMFLVLVSLIIEHESLSEPFIEVLAILLLLALIIMSVLLGWSSKNDRG